MSEQMTPILTRTKIATGAVRADRFVSHLGAEAGAGANTLGVARTAAAAGDAFPVTVLGTAVVEAGEALVSDIPVSSDAQGRAVAATPDAVICGVSMEAATEAGQKIEVLLIQNAALPVPEPPAGG